MQPVEEVQEATDFKKVKQGWWQVAQRGDKVDYKVEFEKIPKNIKIELRKVVYDDFTETLENFRPSVNQDA